MTTKRFLGTGLGALFFVAVGCVDPDMDVPADAGATSSALSWRDIQRGRALFDEALPGSNGRACSTCHVHDDHTTLTPANVEERLAADPGDPLFHPLDADDPAADPLTYEHLKKGLVRVFLPLPDNMDVIDASGEVITPADRTIVVWRAVPSIENTAFTGPYQWDGRDANLEVQAQGAIFAHSEGPTLPMKQLGEIAAFERTVFSSPRAALLSLLIDVGVPREHIPDLEQAMPLTPQEVRGRAIFEVACTGCHGGPTMTEITDRVVHDALFFQLRPDGNIIYDVGVDGVPVPRLSEEENGEFLNIGTALLSGYGQLGIIPMFNDSIDFPQYRFRFYTDGSRQHQVVDLPPIPVDPPVDDRGAPIQGPSLAPQWFSTDPGRAAITGNPADFEGFAVPQLRGIAHTAPYFHDNGAATLADLIDTYSRFILPFLALDLPAVHPPESPGGQPEALSPQEKADLVAFLQRL